MMLIFLEIVGMSVLILRWGVVFLWYFIVFFMLFKLVNEDLIVDFFL